MAALRSIPRALAAVPTRLDPLRAIPRQAKLGFSRTPIPSRRGFSLTALCLTKEFDFAAVRSIADAPPPNTVLIDVREPDEYADGHIPHAINLPVKSQPDALMLPPDEFEDRFGFTKPAVDADAVFYCRSGVRSKAAAGIAERAGYRSVGEYAGSWMDWTANGGKVAR